MCGTLGKQCVHPGLPEQSLQSFIFPSSRGMLGVEPGAVCSLGKCTTLLSTNVRPGGLSLRELFSLRKSYLILQHHCKNNASKR